MKRFDFARGRWDPAQLPMTYALMCRDHTTVRQEDDCIAAGMNEKLGNYDYIGVCMTEKTQGDCTITARCSFEAFGAPLVVLADEVRTDAQGRRIYGAIHEIVAWEKGCNIWRVLPRQDPRCPKNPYTVCAVASEAFPIPGGSMVDMQIRVRGKKLCVCINGHSFEADAPELPDSFFVGVTLCEGETRFYELTVG